MFCELGMKIGCFLHLDEMEEVFLSEIRYFCNVILLNIIFVLSTSRIFFGMHPIAIERLLNL